MPGSELRGGGPASPEDSAPAGGPWLPPLTRPATGRTFPVRPARAFLFMQGPTDDLPQAHARLITPRHPLSCASPWLQPRDSWRAAHQDGHAPPADGQCRRGVAALDAERGGRARTHTVARPWRVPCVLAETPRVPWLKRRALIQQEARSPRSVTRARGLGGRSPPPGGYPAGIQPGCLSTPGLVVSAPGHWKRPASGRLGATGGTLNEAQVSIFAPYRLNTESSNV